jgi:hypothetical protein
MEFWIIGGVTGLVDEVNDVVEPGAYIETLKKRKPKIIKDHDWTHRLGKVLEIFEALPGDSRLPKTTARGEPWPTEAGALLAKVRLFDTKEGRDAATRWHEEDTEQEFSIGYIVPAGKARKDPKTGTRYIKALNCFEISDVLWGAMPMAGLLPTGLATKMLAGIQALETKSTAVDSPPDGELFDADDPEEADLHSQAVLDEIDWDAVDQAILTEFPTGDAEVAAKSLYGVAAYRLRMAEMQGKAKGGADKNKGGAEKLRRYWVHGEGAAKIRWGQPGDFMRCVRAVSKYMDPERAKGYCNLRHQDALGVAPGQEKALREQFGLSAETTIAIEHETDQTQNSTTRLERDVRIKAYDPEREVGADAGFVAVDEAEAAGSEMTPIDNTQTGQSHALMPADDELESKMFGGCLPNSYEARREAVQKTAWELLRGDEKEGASADAGSYQRYEWSEVAVEAMWDDRVIVTRYKWGEPNNVRESFEIPYLYVEDGEAVLGTPTEVRLVVTTVVEHGKDDEDTYPFASMVNETAQSIKMALFTEGAMETKAGRVLSGVNESRLRAAVENLVGVLKAAGVDINPNPQPTTDATAAPGAAPVGAPTGAAPVEAKTTPSGEMVDVSGLLPPGDAARGIQAFLDARKPN